MGNLCDGYVISLEPGLNIARVYMFIHETFLRGSLVLYPHLGFYILSISFFIQKKKKKKFNIFLNIALF